MCEPRVNYAWQLAESGKQQRAGAKALLARCAFFQPFEFRTVVGLKTVLNVIR
jgi:hypothetical protein